MKIQFRQSGGFAGIVRSCDIDTLAMSPSEAEDFETIARKCISSPGVSKVGADLTNYEIEIVDGIHRRCLFADDVTVTPVIVQLVELLLKYAKPQSLA